MQIICDYIKTYFKDKKIVYKKQNYITTVENIISNQEYENLLNDVEKLKTDLKKYHKDN